jgi:hypothetical protein
MGDQRVLGPRKSTGGVAMATVKIHGASTVHVERDARAEILKLVRPGELRLERLANRFKSRLAPGRLRKGWLSLRLIANGRRGAFR